MRLISVTANRHVFNGDVNGKPLQLLLTFEGGRTLRLGIAGDGSGMTVDALPLDQPFDMDEHGAVTIEDSTRSLDDRLVNADVQQAYSLRLEGQLVGVQLLLGSGDAFHFWVDDDEWFWGDQTVLATHHWLDRATPTAAEPVHP